jgi:DNA-nicking Smr family endonuclease
VDCARRSQQAWQSGDKAKAKTLSDEKKDWQKKQDASNAKASALILSAQHWETTQEIDLHGLFLDEALAATKDFLKHWTKKAKQEMTIVLVITGAGHHSENNKAVLRPRVEELLKDQRLDYESVHGDGAFEVALRPKQ